MAGHEFVTVDPCVESQLQIVGASKVCVTPHGASEVLPCITGTPLIELETMPNTWRDPTPQPIRYGLEPDRFRRLQAPELADIDPGEILSAADACLQS